MLKKRTILSIENVYTASAFHTSEGQYIGAGSETEPLAFLYDLNSGKAEKVDGCPGGMMSFLPVPGRAGYFVTIQGLFPPFIGREAGLYLHRRMNRGWVTTRALDLPFAHRCEFLHSNGSTWLIAATVSAYKEDPADWSRPGELHAIPLENDPELTWTSRIIDTGITRNHGMTRAILDGVETVCISGAEGIFNISYRGEGKWNLEPLFDSEVSELALLDLDGDGLNELVTIEPFHGDSLNIYKQFKGVWELMFSDSLSFGHGLSGGIFNGEPVVVAGNRKESLALQIYTIGNLSKGVVNKSVIEEGAGPTQTQVFSCQSVDYILSSNQKKNEVALYSGSLD